LSLIFDFVLVCLRKEAVGYCLEIRMMGLILRCLWTGCFSLIRGWRGGLY